MEKIFSLALTACAMFSFIYGLVRFFGKESPLYSKMIVFGIGCAMLGRLFETLQFFTLGELQGGFHVGMLGILGSFLFFFAANYGQMDALVDDKSVKFRKYRLIALLGPLTTAALFVISVLLSGVGKNTVYNTLLAFTVINASYFHLKHLIIPDVEGGIVRSIRAYNLMALIYALLCMAEMILWAVPGAFVFRVLVYSCLCVSFVVFIPVLARGISKWSA